MKVLTVIDGLGFAGGETRILSMSRNLDRKCFQHSVLTLNPAAYGSASEYRAQRKHYLDSGVQVDDFTLVAPERIYDLNAWPGKVYAKTGIFRRACRLAALAKKWRVDVIDAHLESASLVAALGGRLARIPVAVTMYGGYNDKNEVAWPWTTRLAIRLANSVITDSDIRAQQMRALLRRNGSKVVTIPNGIPRPHSERSAAKIRKLLQLPEDPHIRVIGQISRLIEYKGHEVLIQTARKVLSVEPNTAFLLVGYPRREEYRDHLRRLANQLGIGDRVVITEYEGDIADVWRIIDVHAHASLFDSLPISITEGMSLGKPAAVTSTGGIPEMVLDHETGLVVPPGDPEALAAAVLQLLQRPDLAKRLGDRARQRYEQLYRPEIMVRHLENHFLGMKESRSASIYRRETVSNGQCSRKS
jgi:glycosyltransferase involved in cell wall biosynthesis